MLIALERRKGRALEAMRAIVRRGLLPVVPAIVYAERWRGRSDIREEVLAMVIVEGMPASGRIHPTHEGIEMSDHAGYWVDLLVQT